MPSEEQTANGDNAAPLHLVPLQVAFQRLGISPVAGYRLVKSGKLGPIKKMGRRSYILNSDLERFMQGLPSK